MTSSSTATPATTPPIPSGRFAKTWAATQFYLAVALTGGFAAYLFLFPHGLRGKGKEEPRPKPVEIVQIAGPGMLQIQPDSTLEKKLELATVQEKQITSPLITVAGSVAASLRPGGVKGADYWQFNSSEMLTAYTDWQKATADIKFADTQLKQVEDLAETRTSAQRKVVDQLERLFKTGTESLKTLAAEKTTLAQYEIQGKKEVHEANTAVLTAKRQEAALARQLQQSGLDPMLLTSATSDLDILVADVPEGIASRMKTGQQCQAKVYGIPEQVFTGRVNSILPILSRERHTLRVLLVIEDREDVLRPGMFAEVGLGTDPRTALLMPAEGIVHVGRKDYALVGDDSPGKWQIKEVQVGEPQEGQVEVLKGLEKGDRVIAQGAILLKPSLVRSLQSEDSAAALPALSHAEPQ